MTGNQFGFKDLIGVRINHEAAGVEKGEEGTGSWERGERWRRRKFHVTVNHFRLKKKKNFHGITKLNGW